MIAAWMAYATLLGALFGVSALAAERVARFRRGSIRWIWVVAACATWLIPIAVALRPAAKLSVTGAASRQVAASSQLAADPWVPGKHATAEAPQQGGVAWIVAPVAEGRADGLPRPASLPKTVVSRDTIGATVDGVRPAVPIRAAPAGWPWTPARLDGVLLVAWLLGSLVVAWHFARSVWTLRRSMRSWRRTDLGDIGDVGALSGRSVLVSLDVGPAVFGLFRMRVVIPEWALTLDRPSLALMLAHEREHAVGRDPLLLALGAFGALVMPWNALVWWQLARLRAAIEIDCDARVLRGAVHARAYARLLVAVGDLASTPAVFTSAFAEHRSLLERRIMAMTDRRPRRSVMASTPLAAVALAAMTAAAWSPRPAPASLAHLVPAQIRGWTAVRRPVTTGDGSAAVSRQTPSLLGFAGRVSLAKSAIDAATTSMPTAPSASGRQGGAIPLVRQLGARIAVTTDSLGPNVTLRALSNGRVVVNDARAKRILLLDAMLGHAVVLIGPGAPTFTGSHGLYYRGTAGLLAYPGDSTVLIDGGTGKMILIGPDGRLGRDLTPLDTTSMVSLIIDRGVAAIDTGGRATFFRLIRGAFGPGGNWVYSPTARRVTAVARLDTNVVVRARAGSASLDTLGLITSPRLDPVVFVPDSIGRELSTEIINPIRAVDASVVFPDGTVAFIRRQDYHIDWVDADGTHRSTPKIAHDWHRLSDREKVAIVDSTKAWARMNVGWASLTPMGVPGSIVWYVDSVVPPSRLADYLPPFFEGARADADGRLWVPLTPTPPFDRLPPNAEPLLPGASSAGGVVYDVVNRQGLLIDRVQLPGGTTLTGFAPNTVFVSSQMGGKTVVASYRVR